MRELQATNRQGEKGEKGGKGERGKKGKESLRWGFRDLGRGTL